MVIRLLHLVDNYARPLGVVKGVLRDKLDVV